MADYDSAYTGAQIDTGIGKAYTALQSADIETALSTSGKAADAKATGDAITALEARLGVVNAFNIIGLEVDFENKTFKRLGAAYGKSKGADFNAFPMYGNRKRCNVTDGGVVTAYYGDTGYTETGALTQAVTVNGITYPVGTTVQVMVEQPKFYYCVYPLKIQSQASGGGIGYHLRKVAYYICGEQLPGFKLYPAFYDESGNEIDKVYIGAYDGCAYDVSASAYITNDAQSIDFTASTGDKFSSIAGVKPASGATQNFTRANLETICKNRGDGWHSFDVRIASMEQLLMVIEFGTMNVQTGSGSNGITSITDVSPNSCSSITGSTASLGNASWQASSTTDWQGNSQSADGKTAYSFRGVENPWGNVWKLIEGVNVWGDGTMHGGVPYICKDYVFTESKKTDNYESAGFSITNASGYINAMGYSEKFNWLMIPSEIGGNTSLPVGDYVYVTANLNGYNITRVGGSWADGASGGSFYWGTVYGVDGHSRTVGGRLVYIPQMQST